VTAPAEAIQKHTGAGSPFLSAKRLNKRLKLFLWGNSGAGKTTLALQFPGAAVIDLEGGTELYGDDFEFVVLPATTFDGVMMAVGWLLTNPHSYRTLVIDPITVLWEELQKKWSDIFLVRNKSSRGFKHDYYDFQPRDWQAIKAEFKDLIRKLIALDMNVIVTARQKPQYADNLFMRVIGETFEGETSLPYLFDVVVQMYRDEEGQFLGRCLKDRSNKLPQGEFTVSYQLFEECFDRVLLTRAAKPEKGITTKQIGEIERCVTLLGLSQEQVSRSLSKYDATTLNDLTETDARIIISKLTFALEMKQLTSKED
jgi:hypothetical protein